MRTLLACLVPLVLVACTAAESDLPEDPADAPIAVGKGDVGACVDDATSDAARGVVALANDDAVDADALHAIGVSWRSARAIVDARPVADFTALDAVRWVGPLTCAALRAEACDQRGLCEPPLDVWTWNIEHFPLRAGAVDHVAATLAAHDVELVGFEEVDTLSAFDELLAKMPGWHGFPGLNGFETQVAIAYRTDRLHVVAIEDLFPDDDWRFPRPPLAVTFEVDGALGARRFTVVVVHLKAMVDATSQRRRAQAIADLEGWTRARRAAGDDVILLGDWNDDIDDAPADNVFRPFTDRPDAYTTPTVEVAQDGGYSYIPFRRLIDHILFTNEAAEHLVVDAIAPVALDDEIADYAHTVSDHRPVGARLIPIIPRR